MGFERVTPRPDLGTLEGYHSPQLDVAVRLNTNESPFAPPASWQEQLADEVAAFDFHRYPDREATALRTAIAAVHGVGPENVFAANGSNEVLQTLCLAYGGFGRTAVTFEPTYAMHGQISRTTGTTVVVGGRVVVVVGLGVLAAPAGPETAVAATASTDSASTVRVVRVFEGLCIWMSFR